MKRLLIVVFCFLLLPATLLKAQTETKRDSTWNDWNFRIGPYFWFIGFKGEVYRPPYPTQIPIPPPPKYDIDVGFKDIRHSVKFAAKLSGQYRTRHLVTQFNLNAFILESEAITPWELLFENSTVRLAYFSGNIGIGSGPSVTGIIM